MELAAKMLTAELRENVNIDELNTLELSTAAQLLGLTVPNAASKLPVIEVGPRTRRVTVAAYKAFLEKNTTRPASALTNDGPQAPTHEPYRPPNSRTR